MKMKHIRSEKESYTVKNSQLIWHFGEFCITHAIEKKMLLVYLFLVPVVCVKALSFIFSANKK